MSVLDLSRVGHAYLGRTVLSSIDLTIDKGEIVALVGPSGCGKSTLAHIAAGLIDASEGRITTHYTRHAMIFQEPRLMPWATARTNIAYPLKLARVPRRDRAAMVEAAAQKAHLLPEDLDKYPVELSGGMRQRTAIARALVAGPDFIFYDEPFTALDAALKRRMQDLVIANAAEAGIAGLFITHDLAEAARIADRIAVMHTHGRGILGQRPLPTRPGDRTDEEVFAWVQNALTSDPLFAHIHDVDERAIA
ncbi:ABC transporter ATP-binding protein [Aliiroseovarius sp.]|uniref:ABC transporter ATP-binding protein n=1 Tax=Aliiroseovarius sp. TaxID=1872442 RepID=UPI003BA92278